MVNIQKLQNERCTCTSIRRHWNKAKTEFVHIVDCGSLLAVLTGTEQDNISRDVLLSFGKQIVGELVSMCNAAGSTDGAAANIWERFAFAAVVVRRHVGDADHKFRSLTVNCRRSAHISAEDLFRPYSADLWPVLVGGFRRGLREGEVE